MLNELILPAVADGAHSLGEAVINVIDCEGLGWAVTGDDGEWGGSFLGIGVEFDVDDVIGWCEGAAELQLKQPHIVRLETRPRNNFV